MSGSCRIVACNAEQAGVYDGGSHGDIDLCADHLPTGDPLASVSTPPDSGEGDR